MSKEPVKIFIVDYCKPRSWLYAMRGPSVQVGIIGLGILTGSTAMQWAGFSALVLLSVALIFLNAGRQAGGITIAEARAKLDDLENP